MLISQGIHDNLLQCDTLLENKMGSTLNIYSGKMQHTQQCNSNINAKTSGNIFLKNEYFYFSGIFFTVWY